MSRISITIVALAMLLAFPGMAIGQGDNAALDQYVEGTPTPTGKTPSGEVTGGGGAGADTDAGGGGSLPSGTVSGLRAFRTDGQAVADLAAATAGEGPAGGFRGSRDGLGSANGGSGATDSGAGAEEVLAESGSGAGLLAGTAAGLGGEGISVLLPLILAVTLLVALAAVVARRLGRTG